MLLHVSWIRIRNLVALVSLLCSTGAGAADPELRPRYPAIDGTSREMQERFWESLRTRQLEQVASAQDRDVDHIAILEDDGTLLTLVSSGEFATDTPAIAARFYASHPDTFDYICIFVASSFPNNVDPESGFAFQSNVSNDISGIGLPTFNNGPLIAPDLTRLKSLLNMNDLGEYNEDPADKLAIFLNSFSGVDILAQEVAHRVGAFVQANNVNILGRDNAHWSFFFQSYGSVLEGNGWQDNGDGSFTSLQPGRGYSQLDLYLFGLLSPQELSDPMYLIRNPVPDLGASGGAATLPLEGIHVTGERVPVTIDNITAVHGPRIPDVDASRKELSMAWILVIPQGGEATAHDMEKLDDFRNEWEEFYRRESNSVGRMHSNLGLVEVRADFEARVLAGTPDLTVAFDNDSFGSATSFLWEFGDGSSSTARHPVHTYRQAGSYTVTLRVDGHGGPVIARKDDFIQVGAMRTFFADDFEEDQGWTLDPTDRATSGMWLRIDPIASRLAVEIGNRLQTAIVQPEDDHTINGTRCYVTGVAAPDAGIGVADVDDGATTLVSPLIDLSQATDPVLSFWHWYVNNAGAQPGRDSLCVDVSNDGGNSWTRVRTFRSSHYDWRQEQVRLSRFVEPTGSMRLRFRAADEGRGSVVEAAVDDILIFDIDVTTPVAIEDFNASVSDRGVLLSWTMSDASLREAQTIRVQRAPDARGPFSTLGAPIQLLHARMRFEDPSVESGTAYWYRLLLEHEGSSEAGPLIQIELPRQAWQTKLLPPRVTADGQVQIRYVVDRMRTPVRLEIFDVSGHRLRRLDEGMRDRGEHEAVWDGLSRAGMRAAAGIYWIRLRTTTGSLSRRVVLLH